jgi:hypothetical protein
MDRDLYFTIHGNEFQDEDEPYYVLAQMEDANQKSGLQTGFLQIYIEDGLEDYMSDLDWTPYTAQLEEHLVKPLPPIPEEPKARSKSALGFRTTIFQSHATDRTQSEPSWSFEAMDDSDTSSLQGLRGAPRTKSVDLVKQQMNSIRSPTMDRLLPPRDNKQMSLWPKPHPSDMKEAIRPSSITHPCHIDRTCDPAFDSLQSEESDDLDRWANEIYGPQDSSMTSLRNKRRTMSSSTASTSHSAEMVAIIRKNTVSSLRPETIYRPSTSAGSYIYHDSISTRRMSGLSTTFSEMGRSGDNISSKAMSFFGFDEENQEPKHASEKRLPANKLWRKVSTTFRNAKDKFPRGRASSPLTVPVIST